MTREQVLHRVRSAFAGVPAPADPAQADEAALEDAGIHLLGPEAVRYHFPRIVARALAGEDVFDDLVFVLRAVNQSHARWQLSLFDAAQRAAALDLLRFLKGNMEYAHGELSKQVDRAIPLWEHLD